MLTFCSVMKSRKKLYIAAKHIFVFAAIYFVVQIVVGVVLQLCGVNIYGTDGTMSGLWFMLTYLFAMLPTLVLLTMYESRSYGCSTPIKHSMRGFDPKAILWGVVLMVAASVVLTPLSSLMPADTRVFPVSGWTLITVVICAPILEEVLFRGRFYSLLRHNAAPLPSAMLSAALFGIVHGSPVVMLEGFVSGIILSYLYVWKGSIIASIILHMCNNAIAYALVVLSYRDRSLAEIVGDSGISVVAYCIALAIVIVGGVCIVRTLRNPKERAVVAEER